MLDIEKATCVVCHRERPLNEMRNVDCVDDADSEWIYACDDINPHGLGGTCYGKYDRKYHFNESIKSTLP